MNIGSTNLPEDAKTGKSSFLIQTNIYIYIGNKYFLSNFEFRSVNFDILIFNFLLFQFNW